MNLLYPYSWIKEFCQTDLTSLEFSKEFSLCSSSVEKIIKAKDGDEILEIEITTNRQDLIGIRGLAQEAFSVLKSFKHNPILTLPKYELEESSLKKHTLETSIENETTLSFFAVAIDNIKIGSSDKIIADRLEKCGIRPINNVVDITNYIMLEFGQPLHAFDLTKIVNKKSGAVALNIRKSKNGESITTIDGKNISLDNESIIIENNDAIYDLAGVMGGKNSEIDKNTKTIVLICPIYNPTLVRKTSIKFNQRTQASQIFEKGLDPVNSKEAFLKAINLIKNEAGGNVSSEIYKYLKNDNLEKVIKTPVSLIYQYSGEKNDPQEYLDILNSLGINSTVEQSNIVSNIPSFRTNDLHIPQDIVEEILRLKGYFRSKPELIVGQIPIKEIETGFKAENKIKNILRTNGFWEIYTYSMVANIQDKTGRFLELKNPLSLEKTYLRNNSFYPSHLEVIEENKGKFSQIKIFEMANIYQDSEKLLLGFGIYNPLISQKEKFKIIKGVAEKIYEQFGKKLKGTEIVTDSNYVYFQDFLENIVDKNYKVQYKEPSPYIPVKEMVSFIVSSTLPYKEISNLFESIKPLNDIRFSYNLVDSFQNKDNLKDNKISYTFSIEYYCQNRQLKSEEVVSLRENIIASLQTGLLATVRKL